MVVSMDEVNHFPTKHLKITLEIVEILIFSRVTENSNKTRSQEISNTLRDTKVSVPIKIILYS